MEYGNVPGLDKPVSRIIHGTIALSNDTQEADFALYDQLLEQGCNTFDTAHIYGGGNNERLFGKWARERGGLENVVILAKGSHHNQDRKRVTPWDITADLHDTLARMKVECVDLYILHRDDPGFPVEPIVDTLNEHVKAGKIKAFGGSNWTHQRIKAANDYARQNGLIPFAISNPNYSLAVQEVEPWDGCVSISGPANAEARSYYAAEGTKIFSWSSLASGFFSGRITRETLDPAADLSNVQRYLNETCRKSYCSEQNFQRLDRVIELAKEKGATVPQIALAYIFSGELDAFALVASANFDEFLSNTKAFDLKLTAQERAWLDLASDSRA